MYLSHQGSTNILIQLDVFQNIKHFLFLFYVYIRIVLLILAYPRLDFNNFVIMF